MDAERKRAVIITLAILGIACVLRLVAAHWWQSRLAEGQRFHFGDSESYWVLAKAVSRGGPYEYGAGGAQIFRTPGYPILLAPLFHLRENPPVIWGRYVGVVLGVLSVWATMRLGEMVFGFRTSRWAGIAAALYPGAIGMSVFVLSEAPYSPLLLLQILFWIAAWRSGSWQTLTGCAVLSGLAGGAATLVRPSHLLFTPFALAVAMLCRQRRRNLIIGALMLTALAITMTPWWMRNYRITGRFIPTTLQFGASLYDGLNSDATGASDMRFVSEFVADQRETDATSPIPPSGLFEERLDERMKDSAVEWAQGNPFQVIRLALVKLVRMWSPLPNAAEMQSWTFRLAIFLGYTPLVFAATWGAWRHLRGGWPYVLCIVPAIYLTALHVVFVSSIRYREPAMLPLIVLAAGAFSSKRETGPANRAN